MKSTRREFLKRAGLGAAALAIPGTAGCLARSSVEERPPNIVLIFTDDQGYGDVGCYGAKGFATPNLDRMAAEGMRFTSFYVSQAVCSASRASLLTGCYAERVSIQGALNAWAETGLHPDEETIADLLKARGYRTAIFGKWHLGHHKEFLPLQQGFDEYFGLPYSNDMWPVGYDGVPLEKGYKADYPQLPLIEGNEKVGEIRTLEDQAKLTTWYTERAVRFIEKNRERPFFLYLPHSMSHVPLGVSEKFKGKSEQGLYGDVMMEVDWSVGEITKALHKCGLEKSTLVIFTSDNGPWLNFGNHGGSALPLREGKGTMWEGGARVPCIMRWPGRIPAGRVCHKIGATIDILPTICAATGAALPKKTIDGVNILPLMEGRKDANPRDHYFFYYSRGLRAVRQGKWKLYFPHRSRSYEEVKPGHDGFPGHYSKLAVGWELYDLENDISEKRNVIAGHRDVADRLGALAETAREELGDVLTKRKGNGVRAPGRRGSKRAQKVKSLATGKTITLKHEPNGKYPGMGEKTLIDGERGSLDFRDERWLGFENEDLEAIIDLGAAIKVKQVTCSFLQQQVSWIFLPRSVEIAISLDGKSFETIRRFEEDTKMDGRGIAKDYAAKVDAPRARYLRVRAQNVGTCPDWHPGAGGDAWIFTDEIVVQ